MVEISLFFFFLSLSPSFKSLAIQLGSVWGRGGEICEKLGNCEAKIATLPFTLNPIG